MIHQKLSPQTPVNQDITIVLIWLLRMASINERFLWKEMRGFHFQQTVGSDKRKNSCRGCVYRAWITHYLSSLYYTLVYQHTSANSYKRFLQILQLPIYTIEYTNHNR